MIAMTLCLQTAGLCLAALARSGNISPLPQLRHPKAKI